MNHPAEAPPIQLSGGELKDLWQKIILALTPKINQAHLLTWFKNTAILDIDGNGTLILGAPNAFVQGTLSRKFHADIFQMAKVCMSGISSIAIQVDVSLNNAGDPRIFDVKSLVQSTEKRLQVKKEQAVFSGESNGTHLLNPRYTLKNFVVGENNRLAYAASKAVSTTPGSAYNPLFIYGGVGLGKTHLLQAIGHAVLEKRPRKKVVYVTSEQFTNDLITAISNRRTKHFRDQYRAIDMLIVDDIQFLANKVQTQVEFFHTFNALYESGKQLVLSSDRPPRELKTLEDRLISRFGMGMLTDIQAPDVEMKLAILQKKCQEHGALVPNELLVFVAENSNGNIRELEGGLTHVLAHINLTGEVPTVSMLSRILGTAKITVTDANYRRRPVDHEDIIRVTADQFNLAPSDITGQSRKQEIVVPRQLCMFILRKKLSYSYERIGEIFGGRNHTTVMHSYEKASGYLQSNNNVVKQVNTVLKELGI